MRTKHLFLIVLVGLGPVLAGCNSSASRRSEVVGPGTPASGMVRGDAAYPRVTGSKRFTYDRSSWGQTESVSVIQTYVPQNDGSWLVHTEEDGVRKGTNRYARTAKGVALLEAVDFDSATETFFRGGGLMVMPTTATPEGLYGNTVTVEIYDLGERQTIKQHGTATRDIEFLTREPIRTPAGVFQAAHVRSVLLMELTSANVTQTDHLWIDDEIGIVAEDSKLQVRAFGVPVKFSSKLSLLAEVPSAWVEPSQAVGDPIIEPLIDRTGPIDQPPTPPSGIMQRMP